jgi:hypothetical protein
MENALGMPEFLEINSFSSKLAYTLSVGMLN